jgi:hypothetical protein
MFKFSKELKQILSILISALLIFIAYYHINETYKRYRINKLNSEARIFANLKCQIINLEKTKNPNSQEYIDEVKLLNNEIVKFENKLKSNYSDSSDIHLINFISNVITHKECPKK